MRISAPLTQALISVLIIVATVNADERHESHGSEIYHRLELDADIGYGREDLSQSWDLNGWVGDDINKFWVKSEGQINDGDPEQMEFWGLYSRNVAEFWDFQAGVRHDFRPAAVSYLALGLDGLAPLFFETEAHIFLSDDGDFTARIREKNELLITQRSVLEPYAEINFATTDVGDHGSGVTEGELGLKLLYQITRECAPYLDLKYQRLFGETSDNAKDNGEDVDDFITSVGLRILF